MKKKKLAQLAVINVIVFILLLVGIEGISSIMWISSVLRNQKLLSERKHTQYDEQLGWINTPNIYVEDMYGLGIYLKTNSQSFRNNEDFSIGVPSDKLRIVCSGDSFTLGYGVDNNRTWCHLLTKLDERLETINMGQAGYGVDQAYLWYKRDGSKLEHDLHIFAFITSDFIRMKSDNFFGYAKPVLKFSPKKDTIVIDNVPVPKRSLYFPRLTQAFPVIKRELRSVYFGTRFLEKVSSETKNSSVSSHTKTDEETRLIALKIFEDLYKINKTKDSTLVLVYLPILSDYMTDESELWRKYLQVESTKRNIFFVDLIDEFRKLPNLEVKTLFLGDGHYTVKGNEYIAHILNKKLLSLPEVSNKLTVD
jgi:hypothetical protein